MNCLDDNKLLNIKQLIHVSESIVILPHNNPDGDALGAALALLHFFMSLGKNAVVVSPNIYPEFLHWLPGNEHVLVFENEKEKCSDILQKSDLIVCADFNRLDRLREMEGFVRKLPNTKLLIDHHPNPENFTSYIVSDTSVSSTAELVFELIINLEGSGIICRDTAICLYTGIMTDTGNFNFNSNRPETFEIVAELLRKGVDKDLIFRNVYDNFTYSRWQMLGHSLLNRMKVFPEHSSAYIYLENEDLKKFKFQSGDTEGFVNYPLAIKGINFSAFFVERDKGYIKASFRSKGKFEVNKFSENHFSGGGHMNAAGGEELTLNMSDTLKKYELLLPEYSKEIRNSMSE